MTQVKRRPVIRRVAFTDRQMFVAKETGKFPTHREFVEWLFKEQHKCAVINHTLLEFKYVKPVEGQTDTITYVTGRIGISIGWL